MVILGLLIVTEACRIGVTVTVKTVCKKCRLNETVRCCSLVKMLQMYGWLSWLFLSWVLYYGMFLFCSNTWFCDILTPHALLVAEL